MGDMKEIESLVPLSVKELGLEYRQLRLAQWKVFPGMQLDIWENVPNP